jgi:hypothetical protein
MMNRKIITVSVLLLSIILLIASCSPKESSTTSPETPPGAELPPSAYLPEVPRIGIEEVKAKLDAGVNLVIVDSSSETSYKKSHIAGAISLPLATMFGPYIDLYGYDEIVLYCT